MAGPTAQIQNLHFPVKGGATVAYPFVFAPGA